LDSGYPAGVCFIRVCKDPVLAEDAEQDAEMKAKLAAEEIMVPENVGQYGLRFLMSQI